ncbi:MAG: hypothetical protein Q9209_002493 [Squamulea sp. 1 TL-2023]
MGWYAILFVTLWLWRYLRLIVHIISAWTLKPIRPVRFAKFNAKDVTVVLPTFGTDNPDFRRCLHSIGSCQPKALIIVTPEPDTVRSICQSLDLDHFEVLAAPKANKRLQMIQGIEQVSTPIIVFADDDVVWPITFLSHVLAPFEDRSVGAVGPFISLERPTNFNIWDFLGAAYLERWNFSVAATSKIDGGIACLSGRTSAVRSSIVQNEAFKAHFADEKWLFGISLANADDDMCLTRWLLNHGWKIKIQNAPEAHVTTALQSDWRYINQCVRWDRSIWRGNVTSMFCDRNIWTSQPWSSYALHLSTFTSSAALVEGTLAYLLLRAYDNGQPPYLFPSTRRTAFVLLGTWIIFSKTVKLWPYFHNHPADLRYLPAMFLFAYFHGLIHAWSFCTLFRTSWDGGRMSLPNIAAAANTCASDATKKSSASLTNIERQSASIATNLAANGQTRAQENSSKLWKLGYEETPQKYSTNFLSMEGAKRK